MGRFKKDKKSIHGRVILMLVGVLLLTAAACQPNQYISQTPPPESAKGPYTTRLTIGTQNIYVDVAADSASWQQGLSGRERLTDNQGMLFDMRTSLQRRPSFWMKEMKFPLDIIWIDAGRVVDISANLPAPTPDTQLSSLPFYRPNRDIDMVLEVNAGWSAAHQIKISDPVSMP